MARVFLMSMIRVYFYDFISAIKIVKKLLRMMILAIPEIAGPSCEKVGTNDSISDLSSSQ